MIAELLQYRRMGLLRVVSLSQRKRLACGKATPTSWSSFCVPNPKNFILGLRQTGQVTGTGVW